MTLRAKTGMYAAAKVLLLIVLFATAPVNAQHVVLDRAEAVKMAREKGWIVREVTPEHVIELQAVVNGIPKYYITHNADAADSISTDECLPGGSSGLDLTGGGVTLGIWDGGGVRTTHQEFGGRATQMDSPSATHYHSTHVAGTMIASGVVAAAKGMSPAASLNCWDWDSDTTEMRNAAAGGLRVSNHSYGFATGWTWISSYGEWFWYGDVTVSTTEDNWFGLYTSYSQDLDDIARDYPYYLIVKSAGNDRADTGPGPGGGHYYYNPSSGYWEWSTDTRDPDGDYDCLGTETVAKNIMAVAAVEDVIGGYAGVGSVTMSYFSSWGPTDDGRIKPDISANGVGLYSCLDGSDTDYDTLSGTSMASPNASGSLGVLIQHWRATHPSEGDMRSSTLKGLVLHTADEAGPGNGPDYQFGWGLMNTLKAANLITADVTQPLVISEQTLNDSDTFEVGVVTDGSASELRATISWTDPPGTPPGNLLNPTTKMLVNDLDLRLVRTSPATTYQPWVLNPASPGSAATTGDNNTDNVEQVVVYSPGAAQFSLRVTHKGTLSGGSQVFSLFISGASAIGETQCQGDGDCDDGVFCNGSETCDANHTCQSGADPCPGQLCRESDDTCVDCLDDSDCADGVFCNGAEVCNAAGTCDAGSDPCPGQTCDEANDRCVECFQDADCDDGNPCNGAEYCDANGICQAGSCDGLVSLVDEQFESGAGGFAYQDDVFGTSIPGKAAGTYEATGGYLSSGGVRVYLGPGSTGGATSGGWVQTFNLSQAATVTVSLHHRMIIGAGYESNEYGETILDVDGTRHGSDTNNSLVHRVGDGNGGSDDDTGWLSASFDIALGAGNHTITIGAYNNNATASDEWVESFFDDVSVSATIGGECSCDDGLFCNGAETCVGDVCQPGSDPCPGQSCDEVNDVCYECINDGDCDDGQYCNGVETCVGGTCQAGTPVDCNDSITCTVDSCNETTDTCDHAPDNGQCDNGDYCDGVETCNAATGCVPGQAVDCSDGVGCTVDTCNEQTDQCEHAANNALCDNGAFCDGAETCDPVNDCQPGTPVDCNDGVYCTVDSCNESTDTCDNIADDGLCDDGAFCDGAETCDAQAGCQPGTPVDCDDGVGCTVDACNETTDSCDNFADDVACDDGSYCDGVETCDPVNDCQPGTIVDCDDGVGCTVDSCNEQTDSCDHAADDGLCDDGEFCNGAETCDPVNDCQPGNIVDCDDGVGCTVDSCNEQTDTCDHAADNGLCDDGAFCNGAETCDPVNDCQAGTLVDCDDGVGCTVDACNEQTDSCDNVADDGLCDDGEFCNGVETCDPVDDCQPGTLVDCDDGVDCTVDSCNEQADTCDNVADNAFCDDGVFCNGTEVCDVLAGCTAGAEPCGTSEWCYESLAECVTYGTGDFEPDGDIDLWDFQRFQECFGQMGYGVCQPANLEGDGFIDSADYASFATGLDGPN